MPSQCVIAPSPSSDWERVASIVGLSRQVSGTLFRKHILSRGSLRHPQTGETIDIDDDFISHLKWNFDNKIGDIVQVPLANDKNEHVENPAANLGEVVGIEDDPTSGKIYALVDARKDAENFGKTYLGASAFMHLNYENSKTGEKVGPTLLHVAVTNRPYVTGLDPYEAVAAAAERFTDPAVMEMSGADAAGSGTEREADVPRKLEEVVAELRDEHGVDVEDLRSRLASAQEQLSSESGEEPLAAQIAATLQRTGTEVGLTGSPSEVSNADLVSAVAELAQRNVSLSNSRDEAADRIAALERRNTEREIDGYIEDGRILPAKREVFLTMAMEHRDMFDEVLPSEAVVALNTESGQAPRGDEHRSRETDVESEIARLSGQMEQR